MGISILKFLYEKYNDFNHIGNYTGNHVIPIRILQEGLFPPKVIHEKLNEYAKLYKPGGEELFNDEIFQEYPSIKDMPQPKSLFLRILYINLIVKAMPDDFFKSIDLEAEEINQLVLSITLYLLFLQTYSFSNLDITSTQKNWLLGRDDFYLRLDDLQRVCGKITFRSYDKFLELFSFNLDEKNYSELKHQRLYSQNRVMFILNLEEFIDYMLFEIESLFRAYCTEVQFTQYQQRKGLAFEELAFSLLTEEYKLVGHEMYYYPLNVQKIETDILIKEGEDLIIIECKSGTIDLRNASTDKEIKMKVKNLVKKAYISLEKVAKYIQESDEYCFSNKRTEIKGKSDSDNIMCVHLSMYPIDFISSNIHILDVDYLGKIQKPKITMSFEHFAAIIINLHSKQALLPEYLRKRQLDILAHPKMSFDINELDLYFQLMDIGRKSMLNDMKGTDFFKNLNENVKMVTTFYDKYNQEYRPSIEMIHSLDNILLGTLFRIGKEVFQINKRFIRYLEEYLIGPKT